MANLLPLSEKIRIQKIYKSHVLVVTLIFFGVVVGIGIITLAPALFWSFVKENTAEERLAVVSQIVSAEERKNIREAVADANQKIALLEEGEGARTLISLVVERAIERKNLDVALVGFFYENTPADTHGKVMTISGVSTDRQTLLAFVNELQKEEIFTNVRLPVSNFVRSSDIPFSVSVEFNNNANTE